MLDNLPALKVSSYSRHRVRLPLRVHLTRNCRRLSVLRCLDGYGQCLGDTAAVKRKPRVSASDDELELAGLETGRDGIFALPKFEVRNMSWVAILMFRV